MKEEAAVEIQTSLYGLEAVYKACYSFLEKMYVRLEGDPAGTVTVLLRPKSEKDDFNSSSVAGEFQNELLHQALRLKVSAANGKLREYIVTRALASAEGMAADGLVANGQMPAPQQDQRTMPVLDAELEREIEKLLAEVEKEGGDDPLKILAPHSSGSGGQEAADGSIEKK